MHKSRDHTGSSKVDKSTLIGDTVGLTDKTAIIIDDMIDTGGTIVRAIEELKKYGIMSVILVVTHGILSGSAVSRLTNCDIIKEVVVTNSLPMNCFNNFKKYMTIIWSYAGTWSVEKYDTVKVNVKNISAGDIFIIGGFPGHAVTVIDIIENECGDKKIMLSQSYMPAQDHHILINPNNDTVWFDVNKLSDIGWGFAEDNLKRFKI